MDMPGEKLVIKLWETIAEKGIGGLFRPWQMRREGRASIDLKREELVLLAQAERDAELIRKGEHIPSFAFSRISHQSQSTTPTLQERAKEVSISDEIRREVNITRALLQAERALEDEPQAAPSDSVNDDWLFRWRDSASQVSSEELQSLWGRVLAGEVKSPGSYSLRTLEFLKNISQREAEEISKLSEFVVGGLLFNDPNQVDPNAVSDTSLSFGFLMRMQQLGVISGVEGMGMTSTWKSLTPDKFCQSLISNSMVLIIEDDDPHRTISMPAFVLTPIGSQILGLGQFGTNVQYLRKVGEHFKSQGVKVKLAKFTRVTATTINFFDPQDI